MNWVRREYLLVVAVTFLWGSGHTAGKIALRELDSGQLALLRPGAAWLVLAILVVVGGRGGQALGELRRSPRLLLVLGLLGYAGAGGSTVLALSVLPAGITSLLTSTSPLMLVLGQVVLQRRGVQPLQATGAVVGFLGVVILGSGGLATVGQLQATSLLGVPVALMSAVCWAVYTALAGRLGPRDALVTTALTSGIGTAAVGLVAIPTHDWTGVLDKSPQTWLATLWAGGMSIGCAYVVWSLVLRRLPPASVLPFNYLTPVFSLSVAGLVLGEPITLPVALGGVCVIAGVALSQLPDLRRLLRARGRTGATRAPTSSSRPA
jgi:drug/metabolite transporter (DMT)-like permease